MYVDVSQSSAAAAGNPPGPRATIARAVVGWMIVVTLATGAVCVGLRPFAIVWPAVAFVALAFAIWVPDMIRRGAVSNALAVVLALAGCVITIGAVGALNPRTTFESSLGRIVPVRHVEWLPSVYEATNALPDLATSVAALAILAMCVDLGRSAKWRRRFVAALAFGGVFTAIAGMLEATPVLSDLLAFLKSLSWSDSHPFGMLLSHGTAGTMMALATPLIAMLAVRGRPRYRTLATLGILIVAAASTVNISRTGLVLVALLAPASLIVLWVGASPDRRPRALLAPIAAAAVAIAVIGGAIVLAKPAVATRMTTMGERWSSWYPRYLQGKGAIELIEREPLFGHGAGGYRMLVSGTSIGDMYLAPRYIPGTPFTLTLTASNDYLQSLVEWGAIGTAFWAAIVLGGLARLGLAITHPRGRVCRREAVLVGMAIFAVLAHALVDCPLQVPSLLWATAALLGMSWSAPRWRGEPIDVVAEFLR